jgi:hypothetical protein
MKAANFKITACFLNSRIPPWRRGLGGLIDTKNVRKFRFCSLHFDTSLNCDFYNVFKSIACQY